MVSFLKKMFGMTNLPGKRESSARTKREQLELEVKKGSEEAVRRYRGALEKLAEYDRV